MSWQGYVDTSLIGAGLTKACILGTQDGGVSYGLWAISNGFVIASSEIDLIADTFRDEGVSASRNGLYIGGEKYVVSINPIHLQESFYLGKRGSEHGFVVAKTANLILVGIYDGNLQPGTASSAVIGVRDYLVDNGQ